MTTPELTHGCARCGAQVPLDVGLCERCNPIGLRDVSSSQVHGMAIAGAIAGIVLLAIAGRFFLAGVGPFEATIAQAVPQGDGLAVTLAVTNSGNATGQTTCHLTDPADRSSGMGAFMLTPRIDPGATLTFTEKVTALGSSVRPLDVDCTSP
ncbi:MAG: hypothetical protein ACJ77X_01630 [Chloroflexota bacterium]